MLSANLCDLPADGFPEPAGQAVWSEGTIRNSQAVPWAVLWRLHQSENR